MHVQMRDAFTRVRPAVNYDSITALFDAKFFGKITGDQQKFSENRAISFSCRR